VVFVGGKWEFDDGFWRGEFGCDGVGVVERWGFDSCGVEA